MNNLMENIEDNFRNLVDNFEFPMSDSTQHLERNAQPNYGTERLLSLALPTHQDLQQQNKRNSHV